MLIWADISFLIPIKDTKWQKGLNPAGGDVLNVQVKTGCAFFKHFQILL